MVKAIWNEAVIADSQDTVVVEGNHYFPRASVHPGYLKDSDRHTVCGWKGQAGYYTLEVDGQTNPDAAWHHPDPLPGAGQVTGRIAFRHGVTIDE